MRSTKLIIIYFFTGFISITSLLFFLATLLDRQIDNMSEKENWVKHTQKVLNETELSVSLLKEAESAVRGYLLTNDSSFLKPFDKIKPQIILHIDSLNILTSDNSFQKLKVENLKSESLNRLSFLDYLLHHSHYLITNNDSLKKRMILGKKSMDQVRKYYQDITDHEKILLKKRLIDLNEANLKTEYWILYFKLIILSIAIITAALIYYQLSLNNQYREEITTKNQELILANADVNDLNLKLLENNNELEAANEELKSANEELEVHVEELATANQTILQQAYELERQSKDLVTQILNGTSEVIWSLTPDTGKFIFLSRSIEKYLGVPFREILQQPSIFLTRVYPKEDRKELFEWWKEFLNDPEKTETEREIRLLNDEVRWVLFKARKAIDKNNKLIRIDGFITDIQRVKLAEGELIKQSALLNATESLSKTGSFEINVIENKVTWTHGMWELYEVEKRDKPFTIEETMEFIHKEDLNKIMAEFAAYLDKGESTHYQFRIKTGKENIKHIICNTGNIQKDKNGNPWKFIGSMQDITDLKQSELQLTKSLKTIDNFRQAINFSSLVSITDLAGNIIFANEAFVKTSKYSEQELLGQNHRILNSGVHPKDFFAEMWKTITTGNVWRNEICNKAKDGSLYWVDSTINPVKDENGKIYQYMSIRFLITDRKKVEYENQTLINQLIQQNNDLLRFSYIISHNLRAPVTNIMGLVDLIQLIIPQSTEQIKTALTHLNTSAHRLDEIIEDLNNLLNIKKKIGEKKETFLLSEIIDRVKQLLFAQIEESQAEIVIKLEEVNEVNSIKSYIESILFNLISNAIKFRNPSRSLYIEIYSKINDANLELVVKDNGLGMNLDRIKDKIFMLYNRFHPQIEGKGIGLFLTRTMVENLGGKMTAESNQNEGSIFRITIPIINLKV